MQLLKFTIKDVPIYQDSSLTINLINQQRVSEREIDREVTRLFNRVYKKQVLSLVGINATGKTTTLNFILFVLQFYLEELKVNAPSVQHVLSLFGSNPQIIAFFYDKREERITKVVTDFKWVDGLLKISEEEISHKKITSDINKKNIFDFSIGEVEGGHKRSHLPKEIRQYLSDELSIMLAYVPGSIVISDRLQYTNANILTLFDKEIDEFPIEVIQFLDPSIEYLIKKNDETDLAKTSFELKFYNGEPNHLTFLQLEQQISSGTIKGLNLFTDAIRVLKSGGYMIVDEVENHLNKSIVISLIELFKSPLNKKNATLMFSTHYTEIIDTLDRRDLIYVTHKLGNHISIDNLSNKMIRDEIKFSSLYLNSKIDGMDTAPKYKSYMRLKRRIKQEIHEYEQL